MGAKTRISELESQNSLLQKLLKESRERAKTLEHTLKTLEDIPENAYALYQESGMSVSCEVGKVIKYALMKAKENGESSNSQG